MLEAAYSFGYTYLTTSVLDCQILCYQNLSNSGTVTATNKM